MCRGSKEADSDSGGPGWGSDADAVSLRTSLEQNHSILDRCGGERGPSFPSLWAGLGGVAAGRR